MNQLECVLAVNFKTVAVLSLGSGSGSGSGSFTSSRKIGFRVPKMIVERGLLVIGSSETQDIFRIVRKNWSDWLNILGLGTNDHRRDVVSLGIIVSGNDVI